MTSLRVLEQDIEQIKMRNRRVEADKAWETSGIRTAFISVTTLVLLYGFFILSKSQEPFLNALISSLAYLLSTFSYGVLKSWWLGRRNESKTP